MKTKNLKFYYSVVLFSLFSYPLFCQNLSLNKTYNWKYDVNPNVEVDYSNHDCNTKIITYEGNSVKLDLTIKVKAKKQEDLDALESYFRNIDYSGTKSHVSLHTKFFKRRESRATKTKITLKNGDDITVSSFEYTAVLKIPATASLKLQSKYSDIEVGNINQLEISSHDDNIYGKNVGTESRLIINAKYSKLVFGETGSADINVHDCSLDFAKTDDLKIFSKYSDFDIPKSRSVNIESHDDKFDFSETGNLRLNAKYTDFKSKTSGDIDLTLHDCNIKIDNANNITIYGSKYSHYIFEKIQGVKLTSSHDDNFVIENLSTLDVNETKYTEYEIGKLNESCIIQSSHDDYVNIDEVAPEFVKYHQNGKHADVKLKLNPGIDFLIKCTGSYLKLDNHVNGLQISINKTEGSYRRVEGIKGTKREDMPLIQVEGHDMDVKLY